MHSQQQTGNSSFDVAIVGGGIIGLSLASEVARREASVVVVERGRCGAGASEGNAGWVTPGLCDPLPAPGTVAQGLRWMMKATSPLLIHPTLRPSFLRWMIDFWRSTSPTRFRAGMASLVALGDRALSAYDALADAGVEFEMHTDGLLFIALEERRLDEELRALREQHALGYKGGFEVLDRATARELEPTIHEGVAGAVFAADERHVRPETLTAGLLAHLRERGVEVREDSPVEGLVPDGAGWRLLLPKGEWLLADHVAIAAGAHSRFLLDSLHVRLPLEAAKGYSVTDESPSARPRQPVYLLEAKVGVSPFAGSVRLAGTLELGTSDPSLNARRLAALDLAAQRYLAGWRPSARRTSWAGLRPLLPDGLPAVGAIPGHHGLFIATGHGMLGMTLGPATAQALAPAMLGGRPALELAPFSIARFSRAPVPDSLDGK